MPDARVLVVGQTPPPLNGQAIMIEKLLQMKVPGIQLFHVKMDFSRDMGEIGRFQWRKTLLLFSLILRIIRGRLTQGADILCYPPAGPRNKIPLFRDLAVLCCTRWMFRRTVWYFHASGISESIRTYPFFLRALCRLAYSRPDASIQLSEFNPDDGKTLGAKAVYQIPYGIEDLSASFPGSVEKSPAESARILFVGWMCEPKGVLVLLEAGRLLKNRGLRFRLDFMGGWESPSFQREVEEKIKMDALGDFVKILGVLGGESKLRAFADSDVFTLPTHYESESFGLVAVEAMCFGLPVVVTRWRGLQSIVEDGRSGFLVPCRDAATLADKLEILINNPDTRQKMGDRGRHLFLEKYAIIKYHENVALVFRSLAAQ